MRAVVATVGPLVAGSANNIALSQTPASAGALTLNGSTVTGGIAQLDKARRILITTADTTHIFTVTGTTPTGAVISETVGPITTSAYTAQDFYTVTSVTINGAATAAVTVGTNGIASTPWVRLDEWADASVGFQCDVTGTVSYTIQSTHDDPNSPTNPVLPQNVQWITSNDTNVVNATTSQQSNFLFSPIFVRCVLNSGTGSVQMTVTQYNVANR